jgi:probable phosphoglycerate mutase
MLLYVIRHADPIYNPDSLTELGHKQAEALAERLAVNGIDKAFSSPHGRARMTAEPTCKLMGIEYGVEEWMSEGLAWMDLSGEREDRGPGVKDWTIYRHNVLLRYDEHIKNGGVWHESPNYKGSNAKNGYKRICDASDDFLERLGFKNEEGKGYKVVRYNDDKVAAFCHHGFGTTWLSHLLGIPPHIVWAGFDIAASGITALAFGNHESGYIAPRCICWADWSHVYKAGLPLHY